MAVHAPRVLAVAPHPDDEVLGVGATLARYADEGSEVCVVIVTRGMQPLFDEDSVLRVRREASEAHRILGVRKTVFMEGFPAALLDTVPHASLNAGLSEIVDEVQPEIAFLPFAGDLHMDHRLICASALVALRPDGAGSERAIYMYETPSETHWNDLGASSAFAPSTFMDVSHHIERKIEAMSAYRSQLRTFPHARSLEGMRGLATWRGATVGFAAAEAFMLVRETRREDRGVGTRA